MKPRRIHLQSISEAERILFDAAAEVETMGADPLLTDAVNLIHAARAAVADYVDRTHGSVVELP
jgi:hypothetical protein